MTNSKFEKISSSIDDNSLSDEMLNELSNDPELSQAWERYHLVSNILQDEVPEVIHTDLAASISDAIAKEPTVLAPQKSTSLFAKASAKVIQFSKPIGQMAIAASAAGLMIMSVQQNNMVETQVVPTQVIQTNPLAGIAEPVSYNYQEKREANKQQMFMQKQKRFQALLNDHQQQIQLTALPAKKAEDEDVLNELEVKNLSQ